MRPVGPHNAIKCPSCGSEMIFVTEVPSIPTPIGDELRTYGCPNRHCNVYSINVILPVTVSKPELHLVIPN